MCSGGGNRTNDAKQAAHYLEFSSVEDVAERVRLLEPLQQLPLSKTWQPRYSEKKGLVSVSGFYSDSIVE